MENKILNLLCLKIIIDADIRHTDDYLQELANRYIGFLPYNDDFSLFLLSIKFKDDIIEDLIDNFNKYYGNFFEIKDTPPISTHPNTIAYVSQLAKTIDVQYLRELKIKYLTEIVK
jgi:hypothetical protein